MSDAQVSAVKTKKLGLMPRRTGLPYVVWLLQPATTPTKTDPIRVETTPGKEYTDLSVLQIRPTYRRLSGSIDSPGLTMMYHWMTDNLCLVEDYWYGFRTDGPEIIERLVPLDEVTRSDVLQMWERIESWKGREEAAYVSTGTCSDSYRTIRAIKKLDIVTT